MRALAFVLLVGCAGEPTVEDSVHIDHGFYGQMLIDSDAGDTPSRPDTFSTMALYRRTGELVTVVHVDGNGVYQLAVEPGSYELCAREFPADDIYKQSAYSCFGPCTFLDFTGGLVRADWEASVSGGWWSAGDHCPAR